MSKVLRVQVHKFVVASDPVSAWGVAVCVCSSSTSSLKKYQSIGLN